MAAKLRLGLALLGVLGSGSAGCEAVFGSLSVPAAENCVLSTNPCPQGQVCDPLSQLCQDAVALSQITPARARTDQATPITITGKNFVPGMTVKWNGIALDSVTTDSATQLRATAPVSADGAWRVTVAVTTPSGTTVSRNDLFSYYASALTFAPAIPSLSIVYAGMYTLLAVPAVGSGSATAVFTDFSGHLRGVTISSDGKTATNVWTEAAPPNAATLLAGDLDGDGIRDLMLASANGFYWYPGNRDSTFQQYLPLQLGLSAGPGLALGDLNRDGQADLVGVDLVGNQLAILGRRGPQSAPFSLGNGMAIHDVVIAELDGTPGDDVAITYEKSTSYLSVIQGGTALMTYPTVSTMTPCTAGQLQVGSFGGALPALVLTCPDRVQVMPATGGGKFDTAVFWPVTENVQKVVGTRPVLADFDGDGDLDILVLRGAFMGTGLAEVWFFENVDGHGLIVPKLIGTEVTVASNSLLTVGDVNDDGKPDVIIGDRATGAAIPLIVLFNVSR